VSRFAFDPDPFGPLRIWHSPIPGHQYVIGVDVAEGLASSGSKAGDYSAAFVVHAHSLEHVATWHGHIDPWPFADELDVLGRYYNNALIAVEKNNHGLTVIKRLLHDFEYPNLYKRTIQPDRSRPSQRNFDYGILTRGGQQAGSKALVVDALRAVVRRVAPIHDSRFYKEGLTWVLDEKGRPTTNEGANDDLLMAAAIAYYVTHEVYGTTIHSSEVEIHNEHNDEMRERRRTWRRILKRTQETLSPPNPWEGVPAELIDA